MSLIAYKKKRKFKGKNFTPEPKPIVKKSKQKNLLFVVHEHHARKLHWDLRLEMKGVLKSWAVPKQPPKTKGIKRLAIQVEDHPLEYSKFSGKIPSGYGAGEVKIWDKGKYELIDKKSDKIVFNLKGKKLKGKYVLLKTNYGGKKKSWLFFKL